MYGSANAFALKQQRGVGVKELVEEVCCRGGRRGGGGDASEWGHRVFYADNSVNTV